VQKAFVNRDVPKTTMVLVGEGVKFAISLTMLLTSGQASSELAQWDLGSSLQAAAAPALVYSVQNVLVQTAYPNITSLMFNLLNQTKTLSAAVFVYLLMGKRQSLVQCLALAILFSAAVMLSTDFSGAKKDDDEKENNFMWGILPVLGASALSGFASGLCQVTLQGKKRNSFIFTMELCVFSTISLIAGMAVKDATQFSTDQLFHGWTHYTMIPIACQVRVYCRSVLRPSFA
jgi:UDP-sugar transporter A1/2/3